MEVKNTRRLGLTRQILDYHEISKELKRRFIIKVRHTTELSGPLMRYLQEHPDIIIKYLPW